MIDRDEKALSVRVSASLAGGHLRPRIDVNFDEATVRAVKRLARKHGRSFPAEVRELVREALERRLAP